MLAAADRLDEDWKVLCADLAYLSVGEAVRKALEAMMKGGYGFQSDFTKTCSGRAEGEARGEARAVLVLLEARGIAVSEEIRQRTLACQDIDELDRLVRRAATVSDASELFVDPGR